MFTKRGYLWLIQGLISVVLTLGTLAIPTTVENSESLRSVSFGYPIAFVEQTLQRYTPPEHLYPIRFHLDSPLGSPTRFHFERFALSAIATFTLLIALTAILSTIRNARRTSSRHVRVRGGR